MISRLLVLVLVASTCGSPTAPNEPLRLAFGRSATGGDVRLTFVDVTEDSRCPADVTCVWEGNAAVLFRVTSGGSTIDVVLNTTDRPGHARTASAFGHTIELTELQPAPRTDPPLRKEEYVALLRVTP